MRKSWLHVCGFNALVKYTFGNKTLLFLSLFLIATSRFCILAKEFRNGYVVACSPACRSATANKVMHGYGNLPSLSKMTQHSNTADWTKIQVTSPD